MIERRWKVMIIKEMSVSTQMLDFESFGRGHTEARNFDWLFSAYKCQSLKEGVLNIGFSLI